jgi:hypothetical protein
MKNTIVGQLLRIELFLYLLLFINKVEIKYELVNPIIDCPIGSEEKF